MANTGDKEFQREVKNRAVMILEAQGIVAPSLGATSQEFQRYATLMERAMRQARIELEESNKALARMTDRLRGASYAMQGFGQVLNAPLAGLGKLGAVAGASVPSITSALQAYNKFGNELRATSAQFTKYGQGISQTKAQVESLSSSYKFLRSETLQLMSQYERGFNYAPLKGMKSVFDQIASSVGTNKEAMASMLGDIQSIVGKSQLLNNVFGAMSTAKGGLQTNLALIEQAGFAMAAAGELSVQEAKKLDEFLKGGQPITKEDAELKKRLDEETRAFRNINKFFEDLQMRLGSGFMGTLKDVSEYMDKNSELLQTFASSLVIATAALSTMAGVVGGLANFLQTGMAVKNMVGAGGGLLRGFSTTATGFGSKALGVAGGAALAGGGGYLVSAGGLNVANWGAKKAGLINDDEHFMESDIGKVAGFGGAMAAGAGAGAIIGSVVPVLGTAIGAVAGAAIGGIGGAIAAWFENEEANEVKSAREKKNQMLGLRDRANELDLIASGAVPGKTEAEKQEASFIRSELLPLEKEIIEAREAGDIRQLEYLEKKKAAVEINLAKMKQENEESRIHFEAIKKTLGPLTEYTLKLKTIEEIYKVQVDLLNSQKGIIESFADFFGMTQNFGGGFASAFGANLDDYRDGLEKARKANEAYMQTIASGIDRSGMSIDQMLEKVAEINELRSRGETNKAEELQSSLEAKTGLEVKAITKYNSELKNQISLRKDATRIADYVVQATQQGVDQASKQTGFMEAQKNLADAYGFGLRASVQTQMQVVQSIENEKRITLETVALLDQQQQKQNDIFQKRLAAATSEEERQKIQKDRQASDFNFENKRLELGTKYTDQIRKQAELTKALREGYISAIAAMTTGAGVFTRIVISQEKRLGSLVFGAPDKVRALRAGSELEGRRESGRFGAGSLTEGAAGAAEKAVLSQFGDFIDAGDIRAGASAVMNRVASGPGGSVAAAVGDALYGSSQAFDEHKKATDDSASALTKLTIAASNFVGVTGGGVNALSANATPASDIGSFAGGVSPYATKEKAKEAEQKKADVPAVVEVVQNNNDYLSKLVADEEEIRRMEQLVGAQTRSLGQESNESSMSKAFKGLVSQGFGGIASYASDFSMGLSGSGKNSLTDWASGWEKTYSTDLSGMTKDQKLENRQKNYFKLEEMKKKYEEDLNMYNLIIQDKVLASGPGEGAKSFPNTVKDSINSNEVINAFKQAMTQVAVAAAREAIPQVLKEMRQA